MKYEEYQVWYHVYNNAITSLLSHIRTLTIDQVILLSDNVATHALDKFKAVDPQPTPTISNIDVQGFVKDFLNNQK
jgi:hypothetical protein